MKEDFITSLKCAEQVVINQLQGAVENDEDLRASYLRGILRGLMIAHENFSICTEPRPERISKVRAKHEAIARTLFVG